MLYLYLFGDNVEDRFGRILFVLLYIISGYAAVVAIADGYDIVNPPRWGERRDCRGAGQLFGALPWRAGAWHCALGLFSRLAEWPAWVVLLLWFGIQLFSGFASLGPQMTGGVAFFAHIGGFVCGALLTLPLLAMPQPPSRARYQMLYNRARRYRY